MCVCFAPVVTLSTSLTCLNLSNPHNGTRYPISSFRGNIVVAGLPAAWDEEEWAEFVVGNADNGVKFRSIKECPRCTVPGRNQETGEFHFVSGANLKRHPFSLFLCVLFKSRRTGVRS